MRLVTQCDGGGRDGGGCAVGGRGGGGRDGGGCAVGRRALWRNAKVQSTNRPHAFVRPLGRKKLDSLHSVKEMPVDRAF